ncbi:fluoride efflux transporter CrcB [Agromyces archimandritae]|uniref:Fluoride-specific ion channel FluC n=1 Tax=Agromyces archimandritae TaxID=2781962 RepID=A0A975IPV6_9MICO|nr:fluoride efflux transporter CrcB [Agromyces archimandritae]QTX06007.1 fluoride efflux transporter CrcB [Agromyces archimandritae]
MSPLLVLLASLAGGIGAACRYLMDEGVRRLVRVGFPLGTLLVNIVGSFLLGLLTGLGERGIPDPELAVVLGTGFLGGYTTFSTASAETVRLFLERRRLAAVLNGAGMFLLCGAAALAGLALGRAL